MHIFEKFKVNNNNYACTELVMFTVVLVPEFLLAVLLLPALILQVASAGG